MQDDTLNTSIALIDAISDNIQLVRSISYSLQGLAHSFEATGNSRMADKLMGYCEPLEESAQRIRDAYGLNQSAEIRRNEGFSRDLITGLIGMVEASAPDDPQVKKKARQIKGTKLMQGEGLA